MVNIAGELGDLGCFTAPLPAGGLLGFNCSFRVARRAQGPTKFSENPMQGGDFLAQEAGALDSDRQWKFYLLQLCTARAVFNSVQQPRMYTAL